MKRAMQPVKAKRPKTGGRKAGTPNRSTAEIRALAQQHGEEALASLVVLMNLSESDQVRLAAAREVLHFAYGRPVQQVVMDSPVPYMPVKVETREDFMRAFEMTEAEYAQVRQRLMAGFGGHAGEEGAA